MPAMMVSSRQKQQVESGAQRNPSSKATELHDHDAWKYLLQRTGLNDSLLTISPHRSDRGATCF